LSSRPTSRDPRPIGPRATLRATWLTQKLGRPPSIEEVARALEIPAGQLAELEEICQKGRGTLRDVVADPSAPAPGSVGALLRERADLVGLLNDLPEREHTVIRLRFGLRGEEALTLEAVGKRLGSLLVAE